jgi:hypothetical protein
LPERQPDTTSSGRSWRRFIAGFVGGFFVVFGVYLAAIILIDPYDTGYFPSLIGPGVVDQNDTTGTVGRGRDGRFNAGIFGNSHGLVLDPARLSPATGLSFIQLTTLGTGPREQMALIRYFLRRHADASALVLAMDQAWCTHDPALPDPWALPGYRFPYWLFGDNRLHYLANMLSTRPFGLMRRRVLFAMGHLAPLDPAGVAAYPATWDIAHATKPTREPGVPLNGSPTQISTEFPAIDRLEALLAETRSDIAVVATMPPIYYRLLPDPQTVQAAELASCKERLARAVARRRRGAFVDFLVDSPLSRQESSFLDLHHMSENVARAMEARIADALNEAR